VRKIDQIGDVCKKVYGWMRNEKGASSLAADAGHLTEEIMARRAGERFGGNQTGFLPAGG